MEQVNKSFSHSFGCYRVSRFFFLVDQDLGNYLMHHVIVARPLSYWSCPEDLLVDHLFIYCQVNSVSRGFFPPHKQPCVCRLVKTEELHFSTKQFHKQFCLSKKKALIKFSILMVVPIIDLAVFTHS